MKVLLSEEWERANLSNSGNSKELEAGVWIRRVAATIFGGRIMELQIGSLAKFVECGVEFHILAFGYLIEIPRDSIKIVL
jgi:hypothetical protein